MTELKVVALSADGAEERLSTMTELGRALEDAATRLLSVAVIVYFRRIRWL